MQKPIKKIKSVKISQELIKSIEMQAKKQKRTPHYLMVEALEKSFK